MPALLILFGVLALLFSCIQIAAVYVVAGETVTRRLAACAWASTVAFLMVFVSWSL